MLRNGEQLALVDRSSAMHLYAAQKALQRVSREEATYVVMPRSLLRWSDGVPPQNHGAYEQVPEAQLHISSAEAQACVDLASELSGPKLVLLWRKLHIVTGTKWSTHALDFKTWRQWRYQKVVVLAGSAATRLWQAETRLCPCLPFALSAACEHARCAQALLQPGDTALSSLGKNRGGRPPTGAPTFLRGACSGQVMAEARNAERRLESRAQKDSQSTVFAPAGPMKEAAAAEALDILESADTCARSDATARSISRASGQETRADSEGLGGGGSCRGPTEHHTNFALVQSIIAPLKLPPRTNIYHNKRNKSWVAVQNGATVRGSHAALSVHGTDEACVRVVWAAVQRANPQDPLPNPA